MDPARRLRSFVKIPSLDFLRLRPYGDSLATPAVRVWLGFAWVIILLMASIEGIVWGLVGASIVPQDTAWLRPISGLFMFVLMFAVIWIVDASLIMSERPMRSTSGLPDERLDDKGARARWYFGLLVRVLIVAVSLYVTAPFLAKLIRADDIESYHQRLVEQYYAERQAAFQAQLAIRADEIGSHYANLARPLQDEIARLSSLLDSERQRRAQIEAEYAPEIAVLRAELAAAQERLGDEIHGRRDRPPGFGPEARRWDARTNALVESLASKQAEIDGRVAEVDRSIADLEGRLEARGDELQRIRLEQQQRMDQARAEVAARQPEELPPRLTFAARSKALQALRESPDEAGVPHFETVEGFAQAALAILFFSLIALKLFEPTAVRAYFSEPLQFRYRQYLAGGLAEVPGFDHPEDPELRLTPVEFARLWRHYEADPEGFFAERESRLTASEPMMLRQAEHSFALTLLERRRSNLDQELELSRRRHEIELAAYDNEQWLRGEELRAQLADETRAKQEQRRIELDLELKKARESWDLHRAQEEEALRERIETFEQSREAASQDLRLREKEMDQLREQRLEELRQAESERERRHRLELAEQEERRRREERRERLAGIRDELARLRELESGQTEAAAALRETDSRLATAMGALDERIISGEAAMASAQERMRELRRIAEPPSDVHGQPARPVGGGFWSRSERPGEGKAAREAKRELKTLEKRQREDGERLAEWRDERRSLELRRMTNESQLRETEDRVATLQSRILFHEDAIVTLLAHEPSSPEDPASLS
jgi:hypothetical protein